MRVRARQSGVEDVTRHGYPWTVRDGRAVRFEWFAGHDEALRAAGLAADPEGRSAGGPGG